MSAITNYRRGEHELGGGSERQHTTLMNISRTSIESRAIKATFDGVLIECLEPCGWCTAELGHPQRLAAPQSTG